MGVIESLSAGYRFLIRRLDLLLIPVLLDLLFWLGPKLSIETLMQNFAAWYLALSKQAALSADLEPMVELASEQISMLGKGINLLFALAAQRLFHVPTMLPATDLAGGSVIQIVAPSSALLLLAALSLVGLWIGVVYLSLLARALPIGGASRSTSAIEFARGTFRHWGRVLLFVLLGLLAVLVLMIPFSIISAIFLLVAPAAAVAMLAFSNALDLLIFIYLYFMVAAIIMDDLPIRAAIRQSLRLVQGNFWRVLGFVAVSFMIELGFSILLGNLTAFQPPIGVVIAILANAFIGTGLAMALLIFYRSQILLLEGKRVTGEFEV